MRTTSSPMVRNPKRMNSYLFGAFLPSVCVALLAQTLLPEQPTKWFSILTISIIVMAPATFIITLLWSKIIRAEQGAMTDALSGLLNRRGAQEAIQMVLGLILSGRVRSAVEATIEISVIMIDIDHFKSINDQYGHKVGDEALCTISRHIRNTFHRKTDICCRYGGDEFVVILPNTSMEAAREMTEHLRRSVERAYHDHEGVHITLSCGITTKTMFPFELLHNAAGDNEALGIVGPLLEVADQALYLSKENGRNQVMALQI